ncbi:sodium-dependent nutrient amino acid transporter 1 isoform X2 [Ceratitis capitata]|uniref:sodium-dependent nutrient amino acid transporter 1 isoform X2 n=1 Tax=Ceratitis capitata TaxID=7213 RepID=UPI000A0FC737|nr:sodium-dependent nutrient amino acid transporter 1 isoform X2 [Ceratitis capitata]
MLVLFDPFRSMTRKRSKGSESNTVNDTIERPNWSNGLEFLMSCISMSVGLGNVWRFPFTAYENGGGAFLIPYIIVLFLIGKPMYYLEMILGQFSSKGSVKIWSVCPSFLGVGYGQALATICIITYYSSLLALTLYYLAVSCQSVLPWTHCRPEWGSYCVDSNPIGRVRDVTTLNSTIQLQSSSEMYFLKEVIKEKEDIYDGLGEPGWKLTISLFVSWVVIFLVIMRGVKSSGKAAYFLALFPYVILFALLVRAVTLEGAVNGIMFFLEPNWSELLNPKVWKEAVVQCFFSLAVGFGPIVMFSSYNRFDHCIYRDAMIVTSLDTLTSLLAGISIFGILGNLAHNLQITDIKDVVKSGTGLAFISYPDAIAKFRAVPQMFAVLFFFMLFVLGVGSIVALHCTIVTVICDQFKSLRYWKVALLTSICGFLASIIYVTPGGQWILNLVDYYGGTYVIFGLAILETVGISWIYGINSFCDDVKFMTKREVSLYWRACWAVLTPISMIIIFVYSLSTIKPLTYSGKLYPNSANVSGWILFAIGMSQFPLWAMWYIWLHWNEGLWKSIKSSVKASPKWGPSNALDRKEWIAFKAKCLEQRSERSSNSKLSQFRQKVQNFFRSS